MRIFTRHAAALALGLALTGPTLGAPGTSKACDDEIIHAVLHDAGAPDEGQVRASACRVLGGRRGLIAVAIAHEPAGYDWREDDGLPVYVAWYDPRTARVAASARADIGEDAATQVDASSFQWEAFPGLGREAAALVVTDFVLGSAMDGDNGPTWTLFVADGPRLQAVAGPAMRWHAQCRRACRDANPDERDTRTLSFAPAPATHQGLRDILATLRDSTQRAPVRQTLRFDGHRYVPDVGQLVTR